MLKMQPVDRWTGAQQSSFHRSALVLEGVHWYSHHTDSTASATPHHRRPAPTSIDEEGRVQGTKYEHALHATANQKSCVVVQSDVLLKCRGHIINNEVDTTHLYNNVSLTDSGARWSSYGS